MRPQQHGFTLIELTIVVAILIIRGGGLHYQPVGAILPNQKIIKGLLGRL